MGRRDTCRGKAHPRWDALPGDVVALVAALLPLNDRFKLNCCCTSWRGALLHAPHVWDTVVIDPRRRGSTTRRRKLKTQLPTPVAVLAWWRTYGRHVVRLYARALDAETASAGCLGAATHLTQLLAASVPSLQLVSLHGCELGGAVGEGLCSLSLLTALELQAPASQTAPWARVVPWLGSGLPALEELALSAPQPANGPQCLPDTLSRLSRLRVLAVAGASARAGHRLRLDAQLLALTALQEMALENHVLEAVTTSSQTGVTAVEAGFPTFICSLTQLTSLKLADVALGLCDPPLQPAAVSMHAYALPAAISSLQSLRRLQLLQHTLADSEMAHLARLTGLTSLAMTGFYKQQLMQLPPVFADLTALRQLRLRHGLTQVPAAITALPQLTHLDLSGNRLHTLKPGPYLKGGLVLVNLGDNEFDRFPSLLRVARTTCAFLYLFMNAGLELREKDVAVLADFEVLRVLTLYGASEDKSTRRHIAQLQRAMPWLVIDV